MGRLFAMQNKSSTEVMVKHYSDTENMYASSSGSDSDESNASLLERSSLLNNKFMLPKDLCDNDNIFNEFFSPVLWDGLSEAMQQKLTEYLPVEKDDVSSASKVVNSLFSRTLDRFHKEPMQHFRQKLSEGRFRVDITRLQHNLSKSYMKDKRMIELQRMGRLAQNVMLSREAALFSELQSQNKHTLPSCGRVMDNYRRSRQWEYDFNLSPVMAKSQAVATKRYLSEIVSISEEAGLSLSLSDEEDCLHALPTASVRKQRRMLGSNVQFGEQPCHLSRPGGLPNSSGVSAFGNAVPKKNSIAINSNGTSGNTIDGTIFNAPKLFIVTEDHYKKLLVQHRKRKIEEPEHPELNLNGIKLKDVVSRTQIAAGYRRILPLPKVFISESAKDNNNAVMKGRYKSQKPFRMHRTSYDHDDLKQSFDHKLGEQDIDITKLKAESTDEPVVKSKEELHEQSFGSNSTHNACNYVAVKPAAPAEGKITTGSNDTQKGKNASTEVFAEKSLINSDSVSGGSELTLKQTVSEVQSSIPLINVTQPEASGKASETGIADLNAMNLLFGNGKTHACFLSVVRDLFCSNPDHRSTMSELQRKLDAWTKSPAAERNVWYKQFRNIGDWNSTLESAVQFLAGEFQNQLEDFVPYIENKVAINILQWIGASRDADSRLVPLCTLWQSTKHEMNKSPSGQTFTVNNISGTHNSLSVDANLHVTGSPKNKAKTAGGSKTSPSSVAYSPSSSIASLPATADVCTTLNESTASSVSDRTTVADEDGSTSDRSVTPPPPLFPTDWCVRKATDDEIQSFREQEKRRYESPHMAFTYKQHSYDSVVGPVKGIYTQAPGISKARGHSMLVANRPNFVTILTLVRDATARLPNGEGTRADICELLKSSQYISPTATDQVLQTIVSGALDRMHTEHDPCVKYDAKRKIWIYLHRNRTEQEFERLHMQFQGFSKHKKSIVRKQRRQSRESTSNLAKQQLFSDSGLSDETFASNSSVGEMDRDNLTAVSKVIDTATNSTRTASPVDVSTAPMAATRSTTSLLKKQITMTTAEQIADNDKSSASDYSRQAERGKISILNIQDPQAVVPSEAIADTLQQPSSKMGSAVTLVSSADKNVRTIQIPQAPLPLPNSLNIPNAGTKTGNEVLPSVLLSKEPSSQPPKQMFVSAIVSAAKSTVDVTTTISPSPGTSLNSVADGFGRKSNNKPVLIQSVGKASPILTSPTCSFPKEGIKIGSALGGTLLSIRQFNSTNIGTLSKKNPTQFVSGQSTNSLSPQLTVQAKGTQLSMNNATPTMLTTASVGNTIQTIKGNTVITAAIEKPIYTSSISPSTSKQSVNSAAILQANPAAAVLPQKMILSSARTYTSSSGESSSVSTIVAIKPASSSAGINTVAATTANRIIKPTANLFSTITLTKGQQSILTPANQRQLIQNLLSQNQKQALSTSTLPGAGVSPSMPKGQTGDAKQSAASSAFLLEGQTAGVPAFKIQHNPTSSMKTLSPQIVKITPTRAKTHSISTIRPVSTIVTASNATGPGISNQAAPGVKMMKMHPSSILTPKEGMLNPTGSSCTANAVAISGVSSVGTPTLTAPNATMRVVKTGPGTTTVVKKEVTASSTAAVQHVPQGTRHQVLDKQRKDPPAAQVASKVIVTPKNSTGQLIPLESLLQKQGVTTTANNAAGIVNTFLKIAGTNKAGQQQFLQFTSSSNAASSSTATSATNVSSANIGSVGHQYTILPQTRNIISVASADGTGRQTNLPITIVSSPDSIETFQSTASIIVANKKGNTGEINTTGNTVTSLLSQATNSASGKQVPQGTKVKLLATTQGPKSFGSGAITSTATIQPSNAVFNTKTSLAATDLLNAKIIGLRNIASTKLKGASSLSLMNAGGLNIAHIGGKPVIIANNTALGTNQGITVSAAQLHNNAVNKGTSPNAMLLTTANPNNLILGQQNSTDVIVSGLPSTARRQGAYTNVANGVSGQIQTVMIRNNLLKVQSVQSMASANKLSHRKTIADGSSGSQPDIAVAGLNSTSSTAMLASAGKSNATVQPQQQQQPQDAQLQYLQQSKQSKQQNISTAGTALILTPNISANNTQLSTASVEEKPFVKIPHNDVINNTDEVAQSAQSQRIVLTQPIMIPSDANKSGNAFNFKRLKVIPISKQPKN